MTKDAVTKQELLELAAACEGIADKIDDLRDKRIMSNCIIKDKQASIVMAQLWWPYTD